MSAIGPNKWVQGYQSATDTLNRLPGPLVVIFASRLLNTTDDPDDDPIYTAGFRQGMRDAIAQCGGAA